nr:immunoglobulin heavy chain junction region [Macaca mulatta]MOW81028.1 immunoglobulin heavy chain junction region [Macaca mulatta]
CARVVDTATVYPSFDDW